MKNVNDKIAGAFIYSTLLVLSIFIPTRANLDFIWGKGWWFGVRGWGK
jgi:hypothetical protein